MLGPSWVELFRRIPAGLQDSLVMLTSAGAEIMIQKILVMEQDYFVFRGRMSGSQDSGLVIIMPYDQISNVCFSKRMLEPEVFSIFGASESAQGVTAISAATTAAPVAMAAPSAILETIDEPVAAQPMGAAASTDEEKPRPAEPTMRPGQPSKTTLLAKLRARLAGQAK